ncbi:hypothetical protein HELRODRAFT_191149 [Helobdella robusta]|uniref:Uncharacterized protein n=1 Tax=Helobdella robusta TaxID=6412 RepID=T1FSN3_HELRO|nr:hypothetical protein HELRODRAFT_191149 [Helobdella robusta]ESO07345.1 hypothetical protein HELRODRAFT_191149 [Helobdella robusta]
MANVRTKQCKLGRTEYLTKYHPNHDEVVNPWAENFVKLRPALEVMMPQKEDGLTENPWTLCKKVEKICADQLTVRLSVCPPEMKAYPITTSRQMSRLPDNAFLDETFVREQTAANGIGNNFFVHRYNPKYKKRHTNIRNNVNFLLVSHSKTYNRNLS